MKRSLRLILYFIVIIGVLYIAWVAYRGTEGFQASNPAARPSRPASSGATPCNDDEEQIMNRCYRPCPGGQNPTGDRTTCPVKRQSMSANPICPSAYTYDVGAGMCIKDTCDPDPDTGQTYTRGIDANRRPICNATKRNKRSSSVGSYTPGSYSCYKNGSIPIRYIRIRPMKTSKTNKICINNIQIWDDKMNRVAPLTAKASDGTCVLNPIGFPDANCALGKAFTSGNKYDSDWDGGMKNRAANSFWYVDLGSVVTVKKIEITQCSVRSPETTAIDGLRLEVFKELGGLDSTPLASRVLGNDSVQTVIFNFNMYDQYSESCLDVCPMVGTIQSMADTTGKSCSVAINGITKRSVTEPMIVSQAVKLPCNSQYMRADAQNGVPARIVSNMIQNPTNVNECITCDAFPATIMLPLAPYTYNINSANRVVQTYKNNAYIEAGTYASLNSSQKSILDSVCPKVNFPQYAELIGCRVNDDHDSWEYKYPKNRCRAILSPNNFFCSFGSCDQDVPRYTLNQCEPYRPMAPPASTGTTQISTNYVDNSNIGYICVKPIVGNKTTYKCNPYQIAIGDMYTPVCLDLIPFMKMNDSTQRWSLVPASESNWPTGFWSNSNSGRIGSF